MLCDPITHAQLRTWGAPYLLYSAPLVVSDVLERTVKLMLSRAQQRHDSDEHIHELYTCPAILSSLVWPPGTSRYYFPRLLRLRIRSHGCRWGGAR